MARAQIQAPPPAPQKTLAPDSKKPVFPYRPPDTSLRGACHTPGVASPTLDFDCASCRTPIRELSQLAPAGGNFFLLVVVKQNQNLFFPLFEMAPRDFLTETKFPAGGGPKNLVTSLNKIIIRPVWVFSPLSPFFSEKMSWKTPQYPPPLHGNHHSARALPENIGYGPNF